MKTSELTGAALDWAVSKCGFDDEIQPPCRVMVDSIAYGPNGRAPQYVYTKSTGERFTPSTDWAQGGPIIEREKITTTPVNGWQASLTRGGIFYTSGPVSPTPLVAACRCYVASKLGDTVDVPPELL
jgi:hypothetical protein